MGIKERFHLSIGEESVKFVSFLELRVALSWMSDCSSNSTPILKRGNIRRVILNILDYYNSFVGY